MVVHQLFGNKSSGLGAAPAMAGLTDIATVAAPATPALFAANPRARLRDMFLAICFPLPKLMFELLCGDKVTT